MSHRHGTSWIAGAYVFGGGGLGVLAENIPATGDNGGSYLYPAVSLPADNGKEICGRITSWPTGGTLDAGENGAFTYTPTGSGPDYFEFLLIVDGFASTTNIGYGPGISRVSLQVGAATALLAATTANTVFSGNAHPKVTALIAATTANAVLSGNAHPSGTVSAIFTPITANATFSGVATVTPKALLSATLVNAVFSGGASAGVCSALVSAPTSNATFSGNVKVSPKALLAAITADVAFSGAANTGVCSALLALTSANAMFQGVAQGQAGQQLSLTQADINAIAAAVWAYTNRVITGPTAEQNADALLSRTWP